MKKIIKAEVLEKFKTELELLKKVKSSGITIIHVTHNREEVDGLATQTEYFNPNTFKL